MSVRKCPQCSAYMTSGWLPRGVKSGPWSARQYDEYDANGGVWFCSEACRDAAEARPEPRVNEWLTVDYPSRLRTVSRGFRSRGHAVSYARNRAGWHPYVPAASGGRG